MRAEWALHRDGTRTADSIDLIDSLRLHRHHKNRDLFDAIKALIDTAGLGRHFGEHDSLAQTRDGECNNGCAELCPTTATTTEACHRACTGKECAGEMSEMRQVPFGAYALNRSVRYPSISMSINQSW